MKKAAADAFASAAVFLLYGDPDRQRHIRTPSTQLPRRL